jgi:hypothetical protein
LLFAVPAVLHAAPLTKLTFASIDIVHATIEGAALSNLPVVLADQEALDRE